MRWPHWATGIALVVLGLGAIWWGVAWLAYGWHVVSALLSTTGMGMTIVGTIILTEDRRWR